MSLVIGFGYIRASPDSVLWELSRGMLCSAKTLVFGHGKILLNAPKGSEQISSEPFGAIKYNVSKPS